MQSRISIYPAEAEDIEFITDIKSNPDLWEFEYDIETDMEKVKKEVAEKIKGDWYKQFVIRLNNAEKTRVGEIHTHWYDKERGSWEIGYCILPEYRGSGYCTEAAKLILNSCFKRLKAHKVVAMCNEENTLSYRIMEKIGMVREAVFREELPWNGKWANQLFYCILEREYKK